MAFAVPCRHHQHRRRLINTRVRVLGDMFSADVEQKRKCPSHLLRIKYANKYTQIPTVTYR